MKKNLHIAAFLVLMYTSLWFLLRPLGAIPLAILVFLIIALCGLGNLIHALRDCGVIYLTFVLLGFFYLWLSIFGFLNPSNKNFFSSPAAIQQFLSYIMLPLSVALSSAYFSANNHVLTTKVGFLIITFAWLIASFCQKYFGSLDEEPGAAFGLGTLHNSEMLLAFFICYFILCSEKSRAVKMSIAVPLLFLCESAQSTLVILFAIGILIIGAKRFALAFLIVVPLLIALSLTSAETLYDLDANTGVRAFFWRGVFDDVINTFGLGIGFGNEAIAENYISFEHTITIVDPDSDLNRYLTTGTHNSFMDILQRTGVVGLSGFCFIIFRPIFLLLRSDHLHDFDAWVICALILTLTVNVALSVAFVFGSGLLLGWLISRAQSLKGHSW